MKILIFINQKNYYEEILIQLIFTIQAIGYTIYIDPLYSIIIHCVFIAAFVIFGKYYPKAHVFRVWYHHHFVNSSNDALSFLNLILIIIFSTIYLAYTLIISEIQIYGYMKKIRFIVLLVAFAIHHLSQQTYILLMVVLDAIAILQTFVMIIPNSQNLLKFEISILASINRIVGIIIFSYSSYWKMLFFLPLTIALSIHCFNMFLHHQISIAIAQFHLTLKQIMIIYLTFQLGLQSGLFYLSQILVTHSKNCNRPHCFCTENFELSQQQTWQSPEKGLERGLNQVLSEIIRLYNFTDLENAQEYLLLLSRIETVYRNDRLFETLIRSKKLNAKRCFGYSILPDQFRIEGHRILFYSKLQEKVEGVRINSFIYYTYCNLVEQLGQLVFRLLQQKQQIFTMFAIQYQNPLYYLYHSKLSSYIKQIDQCESLLHSIIKLNSFSIVTQHLLYAVYSLVTCQPEKLKKLRSDNLSSSIKLDPLWDTLNDRQCCYVQCKYERGLIMINHSVLFTSIIEENGIKSEYIGQYIDKLIAGPAKEIHSSFLNRLIEEGKPRLLNSGIQKFFITTNKGFMKQIDSLVRLGQSMQNLTFMTIMGYKQEDSCGKILLNLEGKMYSYCELAGKMLRFDLILQKQKCGYQDINFKLCIPIIDKEEIHNGFILIPKVSLVSNDTSTKTVSTKSISQVSFYKYFLKHPKKCFVSSLTYKFSASSYNDGNCQFETLYLYQCTMLKDLELKMMALEIMLKQAMMIHNISTDCYLTSYTSFKSILPQMSKKLTLNNPDACHYMEDEDLDDHHFALSNESCHIQQDPQTIFISPFINHEHQLNNESNDYQANSQQINNQYNQSSLIGNSFVNQDLLLSSRRQQEDLSIRETTRDQLLIQLNSKNLDDFKRQQQSSTNIEEELESPQELKQLIEIKVSIKDMSESQIKDEIEWIKNQAKQFRHQSGRPLPEKTTEKLKVKPDRFILDKYPSSITSTDSQKGLIRQIVNGMISSSPHNFYSLLVVAFIYVLCLVVIIVLSLQQCQIGLEHFYLESRGGQFSVSMLQNINLMEIAIDILSSQHNFPALQIYIQKASDDYVNYCQSVNYMQNTNYDFLQNLETLYLPLRRALIYDNISTQNSSLQARHFLVDQFAQIFVANTEIAQFGNSEFNLMGIEESYFTLNYPIFFNLSVNLTSNIDGNMLQEQEQLSQLTVIYVASGLISSIIIVIGLIAAQIQILKWRQTIVRTYFLFQNLLQQLVEQESDISRLLEIDELKHIRWYQRESDKNKSQQLKQEQRHQDSRLKKQFWLRQLILMLFFASLELIYFLPFQQLTTRNINQLTNFHQEINYLGYSQLAFSNRLTYFVQLYSNSENNIDENQFNDYDSFLSKYEDQFLYYLPYDSSDSSQFTNLVNNDICDIRINNEMINSGYLCPYALQEGYQKFVISTNKMFEEFRSEYPNYSLGINQILEDSDFIEIILSYCYIFPIFMQNRDDLYHKQENINIQQKDQSILMTVLALIAIVIIFGILIYFLTKQFYWIIMTVKLTLILFSKDQLARNKHLVQILCKEVTVE